MNVDKMSDIGACKTLTEICDGLKEFVANNPDIAKETLDAMIEHFLTPLSDEDFFGTEGWEHAFGIS